MSDHEKGKKYWFIRINLAHLRGLRIGYFGLAPASNLIYLIMLCGFFIFLAATFGATKVWPQLPQIPCLIISIILFGFFIFALLYRTDNRLTEDPSRYPSLMKWSLKKEYR